jgi:hypothetical protein
MEQVPSGGELSPFAPLPESLGGGFSFEACLDRADGGPGRRKEKEVGE